MGLSSRAAIDRGTPQQGALQICYLCNHITLNMLDRFQRETQGSRSQKRMRMKGLVLPMGVPGSPAGGVVSVA